MFVILLLFSNANILNIFNSYPINHFTSQKLVHLAYHLSCWMFNLSFLCRQVFLGRCLMLWCVCLVVEWWVCTLSVGIITISDAFVELSSMYSNITLDAAPITHDTMLSLHTGSLVTVQHKCQVWAVVPCPQWRGCVHHFISHNNVHVTLAYTHVEC